MKELISMPTAQSIEGEDIDKSEEALFPKNENINEFTKIITEEEDHKNFKMNNKDNIIIIKNKEYYKNCLIKLLKNKVFYPFFYAILHTFYLYYHAIKEKMSARLKKRGWK